MELKVLPKENVFSGNEKECSDRDTLKVIVVSILFIESKVVGSREASPQAVEGGR